MLLLALSCATSAAAKPTQIVGVAPAKGGDDVIVTEIDIRLQGIAVLEDNEARRETGGPEATAGIQGQFIH